MSRPSEAARVLVCALALGAQACALAAGYGLRWAKVHGEPVQVSLEDLRDDAAFGDLQARGTLANRLLDRFEARGEAADLDEAMQWIARDWDQQALQPATANRMLAGYCTRRVLRGMWVCGGAD
jgi:hypothetical protein